MAKRTTKPSTQTPKSDELAQAIAEKIADQHRTLAARNWPEIKSTMDSDETGEIVIQFKTTITDRPAEPGNVANKDSRIVTTMSFSLGKKSDKIESELPNPEQPELTNTDGEPIVE